MDISAVQRNKRNYLNAKAAFNARDLEACLAHYAPDHRLMSQQAQGAASIRGFFEETIATWPDIQLRVEHAVAEDDWVMGRSIASATHAANVMGVAPTLKTIETTFWDLHRFDATGRIAESWSLMDGLAVLRQLKAPPGGG